MKGGGYGGGFFLRKKLCLQMMKKKLSWAEYFFWKHFMPELFLKNKLRKKPIATLNFPVSSIHYNLFHYIFTIPT